MTGIEPQVSADQFERLRPAEKALVRLREHVPWTMPIRDRRPGDPYGGSTGYMVKLKCRFCITLDGSAPTDDLGRIGFTSETQFTEHMKEMHEQ